MHWPGVAGKIRDRGWDESSCSGRYFLRLHCWVGERAEPVSRTNNGSFSPRGCTVNSNQAKCSSILIRCRFFYIELHAVTCNVRWRTFQCQWDPQSSCANQCRSEVFSSPKGPEADHLVVSGLAVRK